MAAAFLSVRRLLRIGLCRTRSALCSNIVWGSGLAVPLPGVVYARNGWRLLSEVARKHFLARVSFDEPRNDRDDAYCISRPNTGWREIKPIGARILVCHEHGNACWLCSGISNELVASNQGLKHGMITVRSPETAHSTHVPEHGASQAVLASANKDHVGQAKASRNEIAWMILLSTVLFALAVGASELL
jgi:hypothetical protein